MRAGYVLNERYKIIRTLGEGGMATVYLAKDIFLNREVAIKILRLDLRDDSNALRRFHREARALTELSNPHIVNIYDISEKNGLQYLVMEYVPGTDLKEYINKNFPFSYQRVVEIMQQVLTAVSEAHEHGIIHRDLKPQNILIDNNGDVKITDFGIAVAVAEDTLTRTNTLMGSVHYISPEQARGSVITKQSDIYSLGIIMFEMLTGHVPYEGETAVSIALKHYQSEMPSVRIYDEKVPQALENVILCATAKNLHDRYQDVDAMAKDLATVLAPTRANESRWQPTSQGDNDQTMVLPNLNETKTVATKNKKKWTKKRKIVTVGIALLLLCVGAFLVYLFSTPKEVKIPDLRGMTQTEAKESLEDEKLKIGKVTKRYSDRYYYGQIITTDPSANTVVKQNGTVDIVLSKGEQKVKFGDYEGQSYDTVAKKLRKKDVNVTKTSSYSNKIAKGHIISQSISASKKVTLNSTNVVFTVSAGAKSEKIRDLTNYTEKSVQDYAKDLGLELTVTEEESSSSMSGLVISQTPSAGTKVTSGDALTIVIAKSNNSDSSSTSTSTTSSGATTFSFDVTVPYASTTSSTNKVQIYLSDDSHSFSDVYQTASITQDTNFTLTFTLKPNEIGKYKVVRDGQTIAENDNVSH